MTKNGRAHAAALRDGRDLYIYGHRVPDVTSHPAFRNTVASAAALYDFQCAPANLDKMTFQTETGHRVNRCWQLPKSYAELVERRQALEAWAEIHFGFLGRSPDHVASSLCGMYMGIDEFEAYNRRRAAALRDYYHYARDNDLYLTYVLVTPQADRAKGPSEQDDAFLNVRVCDEDPEGITVRGSKMLGTSAILANEILVASLQPLKEGEEPHALSFAVPLNMKGLKVLSRKSYEHDAQSVFDNPLSSRFDENDAIIYFDDVKVPWERVFVDRDIAMCAKQFHATPAHVFQNYQSQIRLVVKMRFLAGIGYRIAETNGVIGLPQVRDTLGQLAAEVASVESMVMGMEAKGQQRGPYYVPDRHLLYAAQVLTQQLYPKVINTLRDLAGGGVIMLPSNINDFRSPELAKLSLVAQRSPAFSPIDRVKFFKLAWDAVGSEFASRHTQYEMFYAGASFVTRGNSFRTYDWNKAADLLGQLWAGYDLDTGIDNSVGRGTDATGTGG
jgi:4-hydroxyphenylacetate 3-monooxygenase